ncbi:MAG: hypothetical protein SOZ56_09710 [Oscillospiraceae bacterium]|nr:hypothetical protein [Oscillospiraceae bacterium]
MNNSNPQTIKENTPANESVISEINRRNNHLIYSAEPTMKNVSDSSPMSISDKLNQTNTSERNDNG